MGYFDKRLALCNKIAFLLRTHPENQTPILYLTLYESFKEEMDRRGRYKEASLYGDSIAEAKDIIYDNERKLSIPMKVARYSGEILPPVDKYKKRKQK